MRSGPALLLLAAVALLVGPALAEEEPDVDHVLVS